MYHISEKSFSFFTWFIRCLSSALRHLPRSFFYPKIFHFEASFLQWHFQGHNRAGILILHTGLDIFIPPPSNKSTVSPNSLSCQVNSWKQPVVNSKFSTMTCIIKMDSERNNTRNVLFLKFMHVLPSLWYPYRLKQHNVSIPRVMPVQTSAYYSNSTYLNVLFGISVKLEFFWNLQHVYLRVIFPLLSHAYP